MAAPQTFRAIDSDGDWIWGRGRSSYFRGNDAIQADIRTALQIFMGEVFWNTQFGVDWWNLIGGRNPSAQAGIILQCRTVILSVDGVAQINSVVPVFDSATRRLNITYSVNTIFSQSITGAVSPEEVPV
jgi:hypothetical protein